MTAEADGLSGTAHGGGVMPLATTALVGTPARPYAAQFVPGAEPLAPGELRVTILGSGDPWIRRSQASGSLLVEVGNPEKDFFFFDLGSGALANFDALGLPVESTTKVFLSHLHADHIGDIPGLLGSLAKAGRIDPVEIWGGGNEDPALGLAALCEHNLTRLAHTIPEQTPGTDVVFDELAVPHQPRTGSNAGPAGVVGRRPARSVTFGRR